MSRTLWIALFLGLIGAVFALQGIGILGGSQMSGNAFWAVVGSVMIVAAILIGWRGTRTVSR